MKEVEIYEYTGAGYQPAMYFESWRVAFLNYAQRFDPAAPLVQERHLFTDEVFLLLQGKAALIVGDSLEKIQMEPFKIYNVRKGCWHQIHTSEDAKVLIVENHNTSKDNTEYRSMQ